MTVIICRPDDRFLRKAITWCPTCECKTEMAVRYELWYGTTHWCCRCGDSWNDGALCPRPMKRGWRHLAKKRARELWDRGTHGPPPTLAEMDPEMAAARDVVDVELPP